MAGVIFTSVFLVLVLAIIVVGLTVMLRDTSKRRAAGMPAVLRAQAEREVALEREKARIRDEQTRASGE